MCSYCLNSGRLIIPPNVISNDTRYYDCPVCQENLISDEFYEEEIEPNPDEIVDFEERDFIDDNEDYD